MRSSSPALRAFTLIELLAVITVVGILAAILLSVLSSVRQASRSAQCLSNFRQIGQAFQLHAADNSGRYPFPYNSGSSWIDNSWWYYLTPYLGLKKPSDWPQMQQALAPGGPLGCPIADPNDSEYAQPWISYKMTYAYRKWLEDRSLWANEKRISAKWVVNPAQSLLVAEGRARPQFKTWRSADRLDGLVYPHKGRTNAVFADGHAASFTEAEMETRWDAFFVRAVD